MSEISRRKFLAGSTGLLAGGAVVLPRLAKASAAQPRFEVERFVEDVKQARMQESAQLAVQAVLERAVSEPAAVLEGLGEPVNAGIHTLYRAPDLTILNVIWAPLMLLLPHNHNMWASIGLYTGREDNITWERRGPVIEADGAASLSEREVFGLPETAIHSVANPIQRLTGAIHIYGGDFFAAGRSEWDAETLRERPFDLASAQRAFQEATKRFQAGR
jgi:predicted metal-dependent enzyme (double-stranded beta helix superfamily)